MGFWDAASAYAGHGPGMLVARVALFAWPEETLLLEHWLS
jgi:hypothetical protein